MGASTGYKTKILYAAATNETSYSNFTSIGQLISVNPSLSFGEADVSHADEGAASDTIGYSDYLPTLCDAQISGDVVFDPGSADHQTKLITQLGLDKSWGVLFFDAGSTVATNNSFWFARGFLRDIDVSGGIRDGFTASIAIRLRGRPTYVGV